VIRTSSLPTYLTQGEIRAFFAAISNPRDRLLFGLAYAYGLRVGEIVLLDRNDFDLERGQIRIPGLKGGLSGVRPIFRRLLPPLRQYLENRKDEETRSSSASAADLGNGGSRIYSAATHRGRAPTRSRSRSCPEALGRGPPARCGRRHRLCP
jgi:integrase